VVVVEAFSDVVDAVVDEAVEDETGAALEEVVVEAAADEGAEEDCGWSPVTIAIESEDPELSLYWYLVAPVEPSVTVIEETTISKGPLL